MCTWPSQPIEEKGRSILFVSENSDPEHIYSPNMLRFLSRDSRNAQAVVTLKRKADAVALTSKAKKSTASKVAEPISPVVPERKVPDIPITVDEATEIVNVFRSEEFFTGFECTYSMEGGPVLIPCAVLAVMEQLRCHIEVKFAGKKIGLIWDRAAAHVSEEVLDYAKELGIVVELLYAGMTAIMQPCDIWLNKMIKTTIKRLYYAYKNSL